MNTCQFCGSAVFPGHTRFFECGTMDLKYKDPRKQQSVTCVKLEVEGLKKQIEKLKMKTKSEIEWFSGENPETASIKLVSVRGRDGIARLELGTYDEGEWLGQDLLPLLNRGESVDAWAAAPRFDGAPETVSQRERTKEVPCPRLLRRAFQALSTVRRLWSRADRH